MSAGARRAGGRSRVLGLALLLPAALQAQAARRVAAPSEGGARGDPVGTQPAITAADLRTRLSIFAADSMEGRETATPGHERARAYLEREVRRLGLQPAGEGGTFLQTVPFVRRALSPDAAVRVNGRALELWREVVPRDQGANARPFDGAPVVFGGFWGDSASLLPADSADGAIVVLGVAATGSDAPRWGRINRLQIAQRFAGAAAVAVALLDSAPAPDLAAFRAPAGISLPQTGRPAPTYLYVTERVGAEMLGRPLAGAARGARGVAVAGQLRYEERAAPSANVVAMIPGSDPALRAQIVAIGAHSDHEGLAPRAVDHDSVRAYNAIVRPLGADSPDRPPTAYEQARVRDELARLRRTRPARLDSIYNGADDDGSGSVALLEIAESMMREHRRPARSVLFVWHTGEEEGLLGSRWFADHPTVPRDSIVAMLDVDMIGRGDLPGPAGGPGVLTLLGARRISTELGDVFERVNAASAAPFYLDEHMDVAGHPEQAYCRSDNVSYNRHGIPTVSPMTGYHRDYHQVTDEAAYIDYPTLTRVSTLLRDVTLALARLDHRPALDRGKPDPDAPCRQ